MDRLLAEISDSKRRAEILSPASVTSVTTGGFKEAALATTTLSEDKQMFLDTVAISIVTEEESTPVGLDIEAKDGSGSEHVCLDSAALSRVAKEETKQADMAIATGETNETDTAGEDSQHVALDTTTLSCVAEEDHKQADRAIEKGVADEAYVTSKDSEQTCLDTVATSIAGVEENRQVGVVTGASVVVETNTMVGMDTRVPLNAVGETYLPIRTAEPTVPSLRLDVIPQVSSSER